MNLFTISRKGQQGNPTPKNSTTRTVLTYQIPVAYGASDTSVSVPLSSLYTRIFGSVGRGVPSPLDDSCSFAILGYRWSAAHTYTGKLTVYDIITNAERADYGTASSRANVGFNYPPFLAQPRSSLTPSTTVLSMAVLSPAAATNLELSVTVDVVWKNISNPEALSLRDSYRMQNAQNKLECDYKLAGLDPVNSMGDAISIMSLDQPHKKSAANKLLRSFRGKGSISATGGVEYEM